MLRQMLGAHSVRLCELSIETVRLQGVRLTLAHSPEATGIFCGRLEAALNLLVAHGATGFYSTY